MRCPVLRSEGTSASANFGFTIVMFESVCVCKVI